MNISKATENGMTVLNLSGRLDTTTAPDFQETLLAEIKTGSNIMLDFAGLAYVSSAGLRSLLTGQKAVAAGGQTMTLRHVSEEIMEVFDMTGFSDILTIETA